MFLDEPTTGIDVVSAHRIRPLIADLRTGGTTIFLTTHYIEEAQTFSNFFRFPMRFLCGSTKTYK